MRGHPPDPRRYRKSRERVGAQCSTRPASGRFRRGYAVLVGRNRATPRYHLRDRIHPMPELNNISNASLPAFAEGRDSASGYADTRSRAHANGEVLLSRSGRISIVTLLPVQICRQALDQRNCRQYARCCEAHGDIRLGIGLSMLGEVAYGLQVIDQQRGCTRSVRGPEP